MNLTRSQFLTGMSSTLALSLFAAPSSNAQETTVVVSETGIAEMSLGADDAPVIMIEYASFTCPHCASFHENVFPKLKEDYIDTGKVKFVYREVYFDRFGLWAGMLARCAGPDKYFGMTDLLYKRQREWAQGGEEPTTIVAGMKKLGLIAGMTDEQMDACLQNSDTAKALVAEFQKNSDADGIESTPSFVIGGTTHKNMSYADMKELLDAQLEE